MLWKCCTQYASKIGKVSSGHRTGKGQVSFQSQRKAMPKNAQTTAQLHSSHMLVTHSSTLAWKIPWAEKPSRLQSMEVTRVRPDLVTKPPPPKTAKHLVCNITLPHICFCSPLVSWRKCHLLPLGPVQWWGQSTFISSVLPEKDVKSETICFCGTFEKPSKIRNTKRSRFWERLVERERLNREIPTFEKSDYSFCFCLSSFFLSLPLPLSH